MELNYIIRQIKEKQPDIKSVFFVGCGASKAELYPANYFLEGNVKQLRTSLHTANEFNYVTPVSVDETSIVITCSLGGTTPETVTATLKAKELGAHVISVTHIEDSAITKDADYVVYHGWEANYAAKLEKMTKVLGLAVEILNQFESYEHYNKMLDGFSKIYDLIESSVATVLPQAKAFADSYKDEPVIYVMSSGATHEVAYAFNYLFANGNAMDQLWKFP
ncbi:SIS domain-containing protein [Neobacillus drentensis]|uniref:SIS domain-containing protein n=1 Tax=Neobacillus drentensis TaxID=220684 RepID=UPI002FFD6927